MKTLKRTKRLFYILGIVVVLILSLTVVFIYDTYKYDSFRYNCLGTELTNVMTLDDSCTEILAQSQDTIYVSPYLPMIEIDGFPFLNENAGKFCRLLESVTYPQGIEKRKYHTSGGRLRFNTDSGNLTIKVDYGRIESYRHFPLTGVAGLDVFVENGNSRNWLGTVLPQSRINKSVTCSFVLPTKKQWNSIVINFPMYAEVEKISLGLDVNSRIASPRKFTIPRPIVFYGSSITQGCAAGKPSNNYPDLVSNYFDANFVNLGFSSSALGERQIAETITKINMSAFVMEYDHNAPTVQHLQDTHYEFYKTIRVFFYCRIIFFILFFLIICLLKTNKRTHL